MLSKDNTAYGKRVDGRVVKRIEIDGRIKIVTVYNTAMSFFFWYYTLENIFPLSVTVTPSATVPKFAYCGNTLLNAFIEPVPAVL